MVKSSFFKQIIVNQSFYSAPLTFSYFLLQEKVLCFGMHRQVTCEILIFKCLYGVPTLSKKVYLWLYLTQIVHSNGKMLFLAPNNCASLTFFKEKLRVSARISKWLAWTVFTCVEKMLSFGCVC